MSRNGTKIYIVELIDNLDFGSHFTICSEAQLSDLINGLDERYTINHAERLDGTYAPNYQEFKHTSKKPGV